VIPVLVVVISIFLVVSPVIDSPRVEYLYAIGFIVLGFLVYFPCCHYKFVMPGMGNVSRNCLAKYIIPVNPSFACYFENRKIDALPATHIPSDFA